jgi:hypothetical protein
MTASPIGSMVGWTTGGGVLDPGSRDLSATLATPLQLCHPPYDGLSLDTSARPVLGATWQWQISGIPAATAWGGLFRSLQQANPPIDLTSIGMPGCFQHVVAPVFTMFVPAGATVQLPETIPNNTALAGLRLVGQAVTFNPPLTPLGLVASNGMVLITGL